MIRLIIAITNLTPISYADKNSRENIREIT
jgi:hypothetical protein